MNVTVMKPVEISVHYVEVMVPVRYEEEDIPNDFPLRKGDTWKATICIDDGLIIGWPKDHKSERMHMKVTDSGVYRLLDIDRKEVAIIECDYVPHGLVPGEYGDYLILDINEHGVITNWPKNPNLDDFFEEPPLK